MTRTIVIGVVLIALLLGTPTAFAGPWEDGMAAYNRGDYAPAIRVFRALAEQGNAKAQNVLGVMFRKGEGVPKNPVRAYVVQLCRETGRGRRQGRTARGVTNHDGAGNFASRSNGESMRGVELSGLRVLKLPATTAKYCARAEPSL